MGNKCTTTARKDKKKIGGALENEESDFDVVDGDKSRGEDTVEEEHKDKDKDKDEGQDKAEHPLSPDDIEKAFGQEVHIFIHCHIRGYDKDGEGLNEDSSYYDKYGAPILVKDSWVDGYHIVEIALAKHDKNCEKAEFDFPLMGGMSGGAHLYAKYHKDPSNTAGWVPQLQFWKLGDKTYNNRIFPTIRGNEIQNDMWNYDPYEMKEDAVPRDKYHGGYWFHKMAWGRYLHIMALMSSDIPGHKRRYNYIVHPLAYRPYINIIPDNSVDRMQHCLLKIEEEEHFDTPDKHWGEKVNGVELFNDFSYYHSYKHYDCGMYTYNGTNVRFNHDKPENLDYIYWFDTYPLEYCEFLFDTALTMGIYLQPLAGNDAFYDENELPPDGIHDEEGMERLMHSDPKGKLIKRGKHVLKFPDTTSYCEKMVHLKNDFKDQIIYKLSKKLPYQAHTVFGYTALLDPRKALHRIMYDDECSNNPTGYLVESENLMIDYLNDGSFYSHTGVYDLFKFIDTDDIRIPYVILGQPKSEDGTYNKLCYDINMTDGKLQFDFATCKENAVHFIWRYTIYCKVEGVMDNIRSVHGYFKLDSTQKTRLDLSKYHPEDVMWFRFTVFRDDNPMRRAWFCPIKGKAFDDSRKYDKLRKLEHTVALVEEDEEASFGALRIMKETGSFVEYHVLEGLDFLIPKCTKDEKENIYVYSMQVYPLEPDPLSNGTSNSEPFPDKYLQSVHGYFTLNDSLPTRLNLNNSWHQLDDTKVSFYAIDTKTGLPISMHPMPSIFSTE